MTDVTVLMTVYNGMPYLPLAVDSVFSQTLRSFRLVIVNDGSTDGTADYLNSLTDSRVLVLHQTNQGTAAAANYGLAQCDGEFVARMDCDDISLPTRLERQVNYLRAHPKVGLVGTQVLALGESRAGANLRLPIQHNAIFSALMNFRHAISHSSVMFRTALFTQLGGYWTLPLYDDWDMMLRIGEVSQLANLDEVLLHYRVHLRSVNGRAMRRVKFSHTFACELARRRHSGLPPIAPEAYQAQLDARPWWQRAADVVEVYGRWQYRAAIAERYSGRPLRGSARLAWAALCAPHLTFERCVRWVRSRRNDSSCASTGSFEVDPHCQPVAGRVSI